MDNEKPIMVGDQFFDISGAIITVVYVGKKLIMVESLLGHEATYQKEYLKSLRPKAK